MILMLMVIMPSIQTLLCHIMLCDYDGDGDRMVMLRVIVMMLDDVFY